MQVPLYHNPVLKRSASAYCTVVLYALAGLLIFEGLIRKLVPGLSMPVFFMKDILCLVLLLMLPELYLPPMVKNLNSIWLTLCILFLPLVIVTAYKDVILSIFAFKQYLLYFIIGIAFPLAFPPERGNEFRKFIFFMALMVIPTTAIAVLQNKLPGGHWLNRSVDGESLEGFAAAGYMRVSSTFSFTAQYSWFLIAETVFILTSLFIPPDFNRLNLRKYGSLLFSFLILMLLLGAFLTGGRTAVIGCSSVLLLGLVFIGVKNTAWLLSKGLIAGCIVIFSLLALKNYKPEFFAAYTARSTGTAKQSHNEQIADRVVEGFTGWTDWFFQQSPTQVIFGNGLGVMSNGVTRISSYAREIRSGGFWTEGDVPTTFWEGGLYLGVVWYGFRLLMIYLCVSIWFAIRSKVYGSAASVPLAYVTIQGLVAQFGIQPPLSIWWWLSIGVILFLYTKDKAEGAVQYSNYSAHE